VWLVRYLSNTKEWSVESDAIIKKHGRKKIAGITSIIKASKKPPEAVNQIEESIAENIKPLTATTNGIRIKPRKLVEKNNKDAIIEKSKATLEILV